MKPRLFRNLDIRVCVDPKPYSRLYHSENSVAYVQKIYFGVTCMEEIGTLDKPVKLYAFHFLWFRFHIGVL